MRDPGAEAPEAPPAPSRDLFAPTGARARPEPVSAAGIRGLVIWIIAALSLVAGIVIGFSSGYTAGRRAALASLPIGGAVEGSALPADTGRTTDDGTAFTDTPVAEPVRVDPEPVVPSAEPEPREVAPPAVRTPQPAPSAPPPVAAPAPAPRVTAQPRPAPSPAPRPAPAPAPAAVRPPEAARAAAPSAAPQMGSLQVLSRPEGANVIVDGNVVGRTPLVLSEVRAGTHDVRIELEGFRPWATSVSVKAGARARVAASLEQ